MTDDAVAALAEWHDTSLPGCHGPDECFVQIGDGSWVVTTDCVNAQPTMRTFAEPMAAP